jgi:hypothetical protein
MLDTGEKRWILERTMAIAMAAAVVVKSRK